VVATNWLPTGVSLVSVNAGQGTFTVGAGQVVCRLGTLTAGAETMVTVVLVADTVGILTNRVTVHRAEADADQANNEAVAMTAITEATLTTQDVAIQEGDAGTTLAVFPVLLSSPRNRTVTAQYSLGSLSAIIDRDFIRTNGGVVFAPGETRQDIQVEVVADGIDENDETFRVLWSGVSNAVLGTPFATGTILDDDPEPILSVEDAAIVEGDSGVSNMAFRVTLSRPSEKTVRADYFTGDGTAVAPGDYTAVSGRPMGFALGSTNAMVLISVRGDPEVEPDEVFQLYVYPSMNAQAGRSAAAGTILNNDYR
jgi:hypothetical protein